MYQNNYIALIELISPDYHDLTSDLCWHSMQSSTRLVSLPSEKIRAGAVMLYCQQYFFYCPYNHMKTNKTKKQKDTSTK